MSSLENVGDWSGYSCSLKTFSLPNGPEKRERLLHRVGPLATPNHSSYPRRRLHPRHEPRCPRMLPGYNHNIRYKDKVFHVQTEDNGLDAPNLVTQVFLGGQIVAIERASYGDILVEALEREA